MTFYERFEALCKGRGLLPQSKEIIKMTGVSSPSITGWKNGSAPKADVLVRIAAYFGVSTDYLLGVEDQNAVLMQRAFDILDESNASEQEKALLAMFRSTSEEGRLRIIQSVMNICDEIEKKPTTSSAEDVG